MFFLLGRVLTNTAQLLAWHSTCNCIVTVPMYSRGPRGLLSLARTQGTPTPLTSHSERKPQTDTPLRLLCLKLICLFEQISCVLLVL